MNLSHPSWPRRRAFGLSVIRLVFLLGARVARADVAEAQPNDTFFPQNNRYDFGTERVPYRVTYHVGRWSLPTDDYVLYEPIDGRRRVTKAPLVVLFQGFVADGPEQFDRLIRHLTRSGMSVLYPRYLSVVNATDFGDWVERSATSLADALATLDASGAGHVPVERDARGRPELGFVAHSIGSYVAAFVAERAAETRAFPAPLALVFLDPAGHDFAAMLGIDPARLAGIDPRTDVILLSAEDTLVDAQGAVAGNYQYAVRDFVENLPVACEHFSAWVVASDRSGDVRLVSDHLGGPQTHRVFDAIDWWGYWLSLSAQLKYAFWGSYGAFTHAGGRYSGSWRDASGGYLRDIAPKYPHPQYPAGYLCP